MIKVSDFLKKVNNIANEWPSQRLGGDGSDGTCDCIGLVIGAIRRCGGEWNGIHGSNYAARNEMSSLYRYLDASQLELGWAVYKAREPGDSGYSLPSRYDDSPDRLDYYHAGVVTGVDPLEITHCTSGGGADGIVIDTKQGKWIYGGPLKMIDYGGGGGGTVAQTAIVTADNGKSVNMRKTPGGDLIERVPVGSIVTVIEKGSDWSKVTWKNYTGQMMNSFLQFNGDAPDEPGGGGVDDHILISLPQSAAEALLEALINAGVT